ncbi:MAG: hypothetical protein ACFFA6_08375 [Promethearchaeota archaeon]
MIEDLVIGTFIDLRLINLVNYKSIVKDLQKHYSDASEVVIINRSGKLLYSTDNWNVKSDINGLISSWSSGNAQFVNMNKIRYSILQMEPERFIGTNRHKKGHLVGASTPDGDKYMIAHIKPKAKGWYHMAYPAIARAAAMIEKGSKSKFIEAKIELSSESEDEIIKITTPRVSPKIVSIDPNLKAEIEGFLEWIKNPQGLSGYISYYLQQNDYNAISRLSKIYEELYRICNDESHG